MGAAKIICHEWQEFFCRTHEGLSAFIKSYREHNEDWIRKDHSNIDL